MTMTVHNYRPRQFHRTLNGENPSSGYRNMGSASLAAARPIARPSGPWRQYPSSPEGWGVWTYFWNTFYYHENNKANLRDLIAATGLVISNWIKIVNFSACVTVKFDGWPCKTIGHLFYATSSFVHHFTPIGEFKLELQSENAQFGSKWTIFWAVWPRNITDDPQKQ